SFEDINEEQMLKDIKRHCIKEELMSNSDISFDLSFYKRITIDGFIPIKNTFKEADLQELFSFNDEILIRGKMKKLIDELYHNAILKQAKNENITMKYVLKGAGGVGKTTTLHTTACVAHAAGCLVMYINAKYFTDGTGWIIVKINPNFISLYDVAFETANDKTANDGNSMLYETIQPYNNFEWNKITTHFCNKLPDNIKFLRKFVGSIPREFMRFFKFWSEYGSEGLDTVKFQYFEDAKRYYITRIHRLLDRERLGDEFKDSAMFAAKVFMGNKVSEVPGSWDSSGMVIPDGYYYKLCCPAAEYSILTAFDDFYAKVVVKILKEDSVMSWRVLKRCIQYCFRMAARIHDEIPQILPKFNPGIFYVCWRDVAVIDFFIYSINGIKIFLQVSESCYREYYTKLPDLFVNNNVPIHNLSIHYFFSKCINSTSIPQNSLGKNEYYVYLITNNSEMRKTIKTYDKQ
ncbi:2033_t:CDS:2, partial [Funneliformis geosporum]